MACGACRVPMVLCTLIILAVSVLPLAMPYTIVPATINVFISSPRAHDMAGLCPLPDIKNVAVKDYPMFKYDPTRTSSTEAKGPREGQLIWKYSTGDEVHSSPAVANGRIYFGSHDGYVYCLDAETGALVWKYSIGYKIDSSPAVADNRVYIGASDGVVYCLGATTGQLIWSYETGDRIGWSSPVVVDGKVYIGSGDGYVYCLDAEDGSLIWRYKTRASISSSPAVADGRVYIGSEDHYIYCLDAENGSLIWAYETGNRILVSSPAVANGYVYIGSGDYRLYCFNAETGELVWSYYTDDEIYSGPAISNGKIYVGADTGYIYCLDAYTGTRIWSYHIGIKGGHTVSSPTVASNLVYIGSDSGYVYCLDADTGALVWRFETGTDTDSSPAIIDSRLYIGSDNGYVYCLGDVPPDVAITTPSEGAVLKGMVSVEASATDPSGISYVELYVDDELVERRSSPPWYWSLDTSEYSDGQHMLRVVACDSAGNTAEATRTVIIDNNPPEISSVKISPEEPVEGVAITITATITDIATGIERVMLYYRINYGSWLPVNMTSQDSTWRAVLPGQAEGSVIEFYIEAYDKAGNRAQTSTYTCTVKAKPAPSTIIWVAVAVGLGAGIGGAAIATFLLRRKKP